MRESSARSTGEAPKTLDGIQDCWQFCGMSWVWLTLCCAFFVALSDYYLKISKMTATPLLLAAARGFVTLPFLIALLPWAHVPHWTPELLITLGLSLPLEVTATTLYFYAIRKSPLSLVVPQLAFTPVLVMLTGWLLMGERISGLGILGITVVASGAYMLHLQKGEGFLAPILSLASEPGSRTMLIVAVLYSMTSVFSKKLVLMMDTITYVIVYVGLENALLLIAATIVERKKILSSIKPDKRLAISAFFVGASMLLHAKAITLTKVAYFISIKRTSMVFGVLLGWLLLRELQGPRRLAASLIMVAGIVLITISK
jgi:drug/metabolite transporter (DMT)-like permease